jgi:hypothetical protein
MLLPTTWCWMLTTRLGAVRLEHESGSYRLGLSGNDVSRAIDLSNMLRRGIGLPEEIIRRAAPEVCAVWGAAGWRATDDAHFCEVCRLDYCGPCVPPDGTCRGCGGHITPAGIPGG